LTFIFFGLDEIVRINIEVGLKGMLMNDVICLGALCRDDNIELNMAVTIEGTETETVRFDGEN
jgi:hypothetical protein